MVGVKITLWTCSIVLILLACILIHIIREDLRDENIPSAVALIIVGIGGICRCYSRHIMCIKISEVDNNG